MFDHLNVIPFTTKGILIICCVFYIIGLFYYIPTNFWCIRPKLVIYSLQVWRIFSSPFLHGNIVHLIMNILALLKLAPPLERELFGSLQFFCLNILLLITGGILHCAVDFVAGWIGFGGWNSCSIGYSGIIFGLLTIHSHLSTHPLNFFGAKVPPFFYPWFLLISIQIFMPNVSLGGHLSGILAAYLYIFNITSWLLLTPRLLQKIESSSNSLISMILSRPDYIVNPYLGLPSAPSSSTPQSVSNAYDTLSSWFSRNNNNNNETSSSQPNTSQNNNTIHTISSPQTQNTQQVFKFLLCKCNYIFLNILFK